MNTKIEWADETWNAIRARNKETGVTTPGDFGWPDFPGHEKLKRKPIVMWD